jgi:hypothetical protein
MGSSSATRDVTMRDVVFATRGADHRPALWLSDVVGYEGHGVRMAGEHPVAVRHVSQVRLTGMAGRADIVVGNQQDAARF